MICHTRLQFGRYSDIFYVSARGFMLVIILWQSACATGNNIPDSSINSVPTNSLNNAYSSAEGYPPPAEVNNWFKLASAAYTSGDVDQAELHLRKVIELQPANAKAIYNLSMIYLRRAYDGLRHYLALAPDSPARYRAESLLQGLDELDSSGG